MISRTHALHIQTRVSHADCSECRADTERRFVQTAPWRYSCVHEYLTYIQPRLAALRDGADDMDARLWRRRFREALDTRISLKTAHPVARRKHCDSYLERLTMAKHPKSSTDYLRRFASRGASCLDY